MSELSSPPSSTTELYRPIEVFVVQPPKPRYWLHALLLVATIFTTLVVGARMEFNFQNDLPALTFGDEIFPLFAVGWIFQAPSRLLLGIPFSATLLLILLAHEMGHYVYCRINRVSATLPFFVPAPWFFGTMGAVIRIRGQIRSRAELFDIGIAGPIAGFVVAVAALFVALLVSKPLPAGISELDLALGYPPIFYLAHGLLSTMGLAQATAGVDLHHVLFHPIGIAAWVGMFATALNLLPGGQLDGGHIVYSMAPRVHRYVSLLAILVMVPLAYYKWEGWLLWGTVLAITGMRHPSVPDWPGIDGRRRWLALLALAMLILTLTPAPFAHGSLHDVIQEFRTR